MAPSMTTDDKHDPNAIQITMDEQALFDALSHPIRRDILKLLARHYLLTYTDFKSLLQQNPGVIYHHLEKIRELGLVQQRKDTKEYELTPLGWNITENMELLLTNQLGLITVRKSVARVFKQSVLVSYLKKSSLRSFIELGMIFFALLLLLKDIPVLVIGPFLVPSQSSVLERLGISLLFFLAYIAFVNVLASILASKRRLPEMNRKLHLDISLLAGSLLFPILSYSMLLVAWLLSFLVFPVPEVIYWLLTGMLHFSHVLVALLLFVGLKETTLERAAIGTIILQYLALLAVFIFVLAGMA